MMNKMKTTGALIIGSALIWGAVIVGSAVVLKGTECYDKIQNVLVGGVLSHMILIWGPLAAQLRKKKED